MLKHDLKDAGAKGRATRVRTWCARGTLALSAMLLAASVTAAAADQAGKADYLEYCADCHGKDGTGNGPFINQYPMTPPSNLTLLAKENGGKFPFEYVVDVTDGRKAIPSHERIQMPFWGVTLQKPGQEFTPESDASVKRRIEAMASYIESLQK